MVKFDQKEKFTEVRGKLESFCSKNTEYKLDYDEKGDQFIIAPKEGEVITIAVTKDKVVSSDNSFLQKVLEFVDEAGKFLPAVLNDDDRGELQILLEDNPSMKLFKGLKIETLMRSIAPTASPQEFIEYLMRAKILGLNPLVPGEFFFVKNKHGNVYHHVGVVAFRRRAYKNPDMVKYETGVIITTKAKPDQPQTYRVGTFYIPQREELVGGWCKVYLKSLGPDDPVIKEVLLSEYRQSGQTTGPWAVKPATMIVKVAEAQALRHVNPELNSMYLAEELGLDPAKEVRSDGSRGSRGFVPGSELSREQARNEIIDAEVM